jgi:hypothetical protein
MTTEDPGPERRDDLADEEADAAGAEAGAIGGSVHYENLEMDELEPSERALYEAGGGEEEGFDLAESDLIENASHGDGHGDPLADAFTPERESDRSSAEYAEPDEYDSPSVVRDPDAGPDDPGEGPGIAAER